MSNFHSDERLKKIFNCFRLIVDTYKYKLCSITKIQEFEKGNPITYSLYLNILYLKVRRTICGKK